MRVRMRVRVRVRVRARARVRVKVRLRVEAWARLLVARRALLLGGELGGEGGGRVARPLAQWLEELAHEQRVALGAREQLRWHALALDRGEQRRERLG